MENLSQYQDDKIEVKEYINKKLIFKYITEEEIFSHVLGFEPKEFEYICSPLRVDNNPGAFFQRGMYSNRLLFVDYADPFKVFNDCFDFIQRYYHLQSFYHSLKFVKENIIEKRGFTEVLENAREVSVIPQKKPAEIIIEVRPFSPTDGAYWSKYGITRENLIEDKVFAVQKIFLKNGRKGDKRIPVYTKCYAFTNFRDNRKKLYFPFKKGKYRFLSTCTKNDVILDTLDRESPQLVISKSYKDYRVLKNLSVNTIWFQNEGAFPDNLQEIVEGFSDVVVFFDNDNTGLLTSEKLVSIINSFSISSRKVNFDPELLEKGIKDPADMFSKRGVNSLEDFLLQNNIQYETNRHNSQ